ncbi:hypothetical protein ACG83_41620 [Frankia sp. R43]|nr:hypothetical protein ACG83_41620 [Frankia sp. R43]
MVVGMTEILRSSSCGFELPLLPGETITEILDPPGSEGARRTWGAAVVTESGIEVTVRASWVIDRHEMGLR